MAVDVDGDGWQDTDGDCCDSLNAACPHPALVNPGAWEIPGNLVDDDCDAATSDVIAPAPCSNNASFNAVTAVQVMQAMDLCQSTTANPPLPLRKWGLLNSGFAMADGSAPNTTELNNISNKQAAVLVDFGTLVPPEGPTMAGLSTGLMRDQNDAGYVAPAGGTSHGSAHPVPADFLAAHGGTMPQGSTCEGICPATSNVANDGVNLRSSIRTPTNVVAFRYRYRYFVSDFSVYRCTTYNDWHLALLDSQHPALAPDKNIAIDADGHFVRSGDFPFPVCQPISCYACPDGLTPLSLTGFQVSGAGAATRWETATARIVPGETIDLRWMVFESNDGLYDSSVLLDGFQWLPEVVFGGRLTGGFE